MGIAKKVLDPTLLNAGGNPKIVRESLMVRAMPRAMFNMPRVTTKAGIFHFSDTNPLNNPAIIPTRILAIILRKIAAGAGNSVLVIIFPETIVHNASTDPTDRSIPPSRITKVIPRAITVLMLIWVKIFVILTSVPNWGAAMEKTTQRRISVTPIPPSRSI
jgi:hypothetical protein